MHSCSAPPPSGLSVPSRRPLLLALPAGAGAGLGAAAGFAAGALVGAAITTQPPAQPLYVQDPPVVYVESEWVFLLLINLITTPLDAGTTGIYLLLSNPELEP